MNNYRSKNRDQTKNVRGKNYKKIMWTLGIPMDAAEAEKRGLVSKVVPAGQLVDTVIAVAEKIASNSKLINQVSRFDVASIFKIRLLLAILIIFPCFLFY